MEWNFLNSLILSTVLALIVLCLIYPLFRKTNRTAKLMLWFVLLSNMVILQVILIDIGITKAYPILLLFYTPFQFLCPVLFLSFTYSYLEQYLLFKKRQVMLLVPFILFFLLYTLLKVNVVQGYALIPKSLATWIGNELDENTALAISLLGAVWNYNIIRNYERKIGNLPYTLVTKKTKWLKQIFMGMVVLCVLWGLVIVYLKIDDSVSGHGPYYPLWLLFIAFYGIVLICGFKHLRDVEEEKNKEKKRLASINSAFDISEVHSFLASIDESKYQATEVLEYFATSLFDKHTESDVLWDIAKNCISKLNLEDCVIYLFDNESHTLFQKAAYGNKDKGNKKIVSPIEIPLGEGIVGSVAKTKKWMLVDNIDTDRRYIVDDIKRKSELAVPILHEDRLIGVLDSENSEKGFFTEKHIFLFQLIAKLTATKLVQIKKSHGPVLSDDNVHYKKLKHWLESGKAFLDPNLSLQMSSDHLNISAGYLSQIINTLAGVNFSEFINVYRTNEAKKILVHPDYSNYTIVAIGLEAGFNSKSAFYTAFKKHIGETPSEYRQRYRMVS